MQEILVIDFDDSFIFNICEQISKLGLSYCVLNHSLVSKDIISKYKVCLLGPGPGHLEEYKHVSECLSRCEYVKFVGICLGFQMIADYLGFEVKKLNSPIHGESKNLENMAEFLKKDKFYGQFYNSWGVFKNKDVSCQEYVIDLGMVVYLKEGRFTGVQFHPESVGSDRPLEMINFLIKGDYGERRESN